MSDFTSDTPVKRCSRCGELKPLTEFYPDKRASDGKASRCRHCDSIAHGYKEPGKNIAYKKTIPPEPEGMRWCTTCQQMKPIEEFRTERRKSTFGRLCLACKREASVIWRQENADYVKEYRAANRERYRFLSLRHYYEHHEHYLERNRQWRQDNPERSRDYIKQAHAKKPDHYRKLKVVRQGRRRANQLSLPNAFTAEDWQRALDYFGHRCAVCGRLPDFWTTLHADHWIPLSDPRPDNPGTVPWNIVPLCGAKSGVPSGEPCCNLSKSDKEPFAWLVDKYGKQKAKEITERIQGYFAAVR